MCKVKTNPMYREIAKLLRLTDKAKEVFIESYYDGQMHTQKLNNPIMNYNSNTNSISVIALNDYDTYALDLDGLEDIDSLGTDTLENQVYFDYFLHFSKDRCVEISNEW